MVTLPQGTIRNTIVQYPEAQLPSSIFRLDSQVLSILSEFAT